MAIRCADRQYLYCYSFNQVCLVHSPHMVSSLSGPVQCACGRCHELQVLTQCGPTLDGYVGGVHGEQWQGDPATLPVLLHRVGTLFFQPGPPCSSHNSPYRVHGDEAVL